MYNYHEISDNEYLPKYTGYNTRFKNEFIGNFTYNYKNWYVSGVLN